MRRREKGEKTRREGEKTRRGRKGRNKNRTK